MSATSYSFEPFDRADLFAGVRRLVLKVGSRVLSTGEHLLDIPYLDELLDQIAAVRQRGIEVALVTSGAVAAGMGCLRRAKRPEGVDELQALAAIGQSMLMHHYARAAARHELNVAQVLLTAGELSQKATYLHVQNALRAIFTLGALPIVNENDSAAVEELRFGDNDSLSAHVANLVSADALVIYTDIDGLYDCNPGCEGARLIRTVSNVDRNVEDLCGGSVSATGVGGMQTKVAAAKTAAASGIPTVIANGRTTRLVDILAGDDAGTLFLAQGDHTRGHYRWILAQKVAGRIVVDAGAARAVLRGSSSLLPSGVVRVVGDFQKGDAVSITGEDGTELARGLAAYPSDDARKIAGRQSSTISELLGYADGEEMVHRDNLAIVLNGGA